MQASLGHAPPPPQTYHLRSGRVAKSMMGSTEDWAFGSEPWTAPALEDLLPELSREEQLRLQSHLREHERILKWRKKNSFPLASLRSEDERDAVIIPHVRYALHRYNAKHPGEEFDAVKPLMGSSVRFRGQVWFHINFWARCRKSKKVKRFFAEVRYKPSGSSSVRPGLPFPVPGAEKPPRSGSDCLDLSFPDPGAEKQPSSSSISSDLSTPVPEAEKQCSSSSACLDVPFPLPIPIVEACTIIEEPLSRYWRSCAFCRGHLDILHPMGRKFICGNDKDRVVQRLLPCGSTGDMPFTCGQGPASPNSQVEED